ncbi:hypothetical protein AMTRI_Chr06g178080 [Amborella trichopoda]
MASLKTLAIVLFIFSTSLIFRPSIAGTIGGLRLKVTHRDSPDSPFYEPNATDYDRARLAFDRSQSRACYLKRALEGKSLVTGYSPSSIKSSPLNVDGEYIVTVLIGTDQQEVPLVMDTGSDLTWTQCDPCKICFKQPVPLFRPAGSGTYEQRDCTDPLCKDVNPGCSGKCTYQQSYLDGSKSSGNYATEVFFFKSAEFGLVNARPVAFGCGDNNVGMFDGHAAGVLGLGGNPPSIVSQFGDTLGHVFAYCVLSSLEPGMLVLGPSFHRPQEGLQKTPLHSSTPYILELMDISVGGVSIGVPPGTFDPTKTDQAFVIDSGIWYSYLPQDVYNKAVAAVKNAVHFPELGLPFGPFGLCYNVTTPSDILRFPEFTYHFSGDANWRVGPQNMYIGEENNVVCLAVAPDQKLGALGIRAQRDTYVEYSTLRGVLNFGPANCAEL